MDLMFYLLPLFFLTAMIYASAGFGGGSTYLALLVLFGFPYASIPKIALILNIVVVSGGLFHYIKSENLKWQQAVPFIIPSMLFAYLGGRIPIGKTLFLILLGVSLAFAGLRLLLTNSIPAQAVVATRFAQWMIGTCLGGLIGFLSGLVGIGGGIFSACCRATQELNSLSSLIRSRSSLRGCANRTRKSWSTPTPAPSWPTRQSMPLSSRHRYLRTTTWRAQLWRHASMSWSRSRCARRAPRQATLSHGRRPTG